MPARKLFKYQVLSGRKGWDNLGFQRFPPIVFLVETLSTTSNLWDYQVLFILDNNSHLKGMLFISLET